MGFKVPRRALFMTLGVPTTVSTARSIHLVHCMYAPGEPAHLKKLKGLAWKRLADPSECRLYLKGEGKGKAVMVPLSEAIARLSPGLYLHKSPRTHDNYLVTTEEYQIARFQDLREKPKTKNEPPKRKQFVRAGRGKQLHLTPTLESKGYASRLSVAYNHLADGARLEMHVRVTKAGRHKEKDMDSLLSTNPHLRPEPILKAMPEGTSMMCQPLFEPQREELIWVMETAGSWKKGRQATGWTGSPNKPQNPVAKKILKDLPVIERPVAQDT